MIKTVFGDAAPKKAVILITKAEAVLDDSRMQKAKKKLVEAKMQEAEEIAATFGACKPIYWFNHFDVKDEDGEYTYAEELLEPLGLTRADVPDQDVAVPSHESPSFPAAFLPYYLPYWRREFQRCYDSIEVADSFPTQLKRCVDEITRRVMKFHAKTETCTFYGVAAHKSTTPGYW